MPALPSRLAPSPPAALVVRGLNPPSVVGDLLRIVNDHFPTLVQRHVLRQSALVTCRSQSGREDGSVPLWSNFIQPAQGSNLSHLSRTVSSNF